MGCRDWPSRNASAQQASRGWSRLVAPGRTWSRLVALGQTSFPGKWTRWTRWTRWTGCRRLVSWASGFGRGELGRTEPTWTRGDGNGQSESHLVAIGRKWRNGVSRGAAESRMWLRWRRIWFGFPAPCAARRRSWSNLVKPGRTWSNFISGDGQNGRKWTGWTDMFRRGKPGSQLR